MAAYDEWLPVQIMVQVGHNTFGLSVVREHRPYVVHLLIFFTRARTDT